MILNQFKPILSSDEKAFANCEGFIDKMASFMKSYTVRPNEVAVLVPQNILFCPIDLKTNFINAIVEKDDLIDFIKLLKQNGIFQFSTWFQIAQHFYHEFSI